MKRKIQVILSIAMTALLAGCAPITARGLENKAALEKVLAKAKDLGLGSGSANKDCAVPFDCSANDLYSSTIMLDSPELSDAQVCEKLFALGQALGFVNWRRDYHETEESYDQRNMDSGVKACGESLAVNEGTGNASQSEGVIVFGAVDSAEGPISINLHVNSVNDPEWNNDAKRGYYVTFQTTDG